MIYVLDEIVLDPGHAPEVLALLQRSYRPNSEARGMTLLHRWISPPVAIEGVSNTLRLLWQVADAPAYYAMRASIDASSMAVWPEVDALCETRHRHVMSDAAVALRWPKEREHEA
jgi:hypothetical protein